MVRRVELKEINDGAITLHYEDGQDRLGLGWKTERVYRFDKKNADKLRSYLSARRTGTLADMFFAEFGRQFDEILFDGICRFRGIHFTADVRPA